VPGLAFDSAGGRLGMGLGVFDKLLCDSSAIKVGVGYSWQLIASVPTDAWDVKMDFFVTEQGVIKPGSFSEIML